jgi:hypothetical protein
MECLKSRFLKDVAINPYFPGATSYRPGNAALPLSRNCKNKISPTKESLSEVVEIPILARQPLFAPAPNRLAPP